MLLGTLLFLAQYGGGGNGGGGGGGGYSAGYWVIVAIAAVVVLAVAGWVVSRIRARRRTGSMPEPHSRWTDRAA